MLYAKLCAQSVALDGVTAVEKHICRWHSEFPVWIPIYSHVHIHHFTNRTMDATREYFRFGVGIFIFSFLYFSDFSECLWIVGWWQLTDQTRLQNMFIEVEIYLLLFFFICKIATLRNACKRTKHFKKVYYSSYDIAWLVPILFTNDEAISGFMDFCNSLMNFVWPFIV